MRLDRDQIQTICFHEVKNRWLAAKDTFPDFLTKISKDIKLKNEHYIQDISSTFQKHFNQFPRTIFERKKWIRRTMDLLQNLLQEETVIGVHASISKESIDNYHKELKTFLRHVRSFSPELAMDDIGQAIRNYIVYIMFVELYQIESDFHIACFGYSMLYPFTDNYIDNTAISQIEKQEYNMMIRDKILGNPVSPKSKHQIKTCELLQAIETRYPREKDDTIFQLLLIMLDAQETSLRQQKKGTPLSTEERLSISLYKGGVSVLIDRYFVDVDLTEEDLIFYLGFGYFLQLADDLQDIREDSTNGNQTLLTVDLHPQQEEKIVNKMFHFLNELLNEYPIKNSSFKEFIKNNCFQLIFSSIAGSKEFFSKKYLNQLELYLPVTLPFMEHMKLNPVEGKDRKLKDKHMKILDEMIRS